MLIRKHYQFLSHQVVLEEVTWNDGRKVGKKSLFVVSFLLSHWSVFILPGIDSPLLPGFSTWLLQTAAKEVDPVGSDHCAGATLDPMTAGLMEATLKSGPHPPLSAAVRAHSMTAIAARLPTEQLSEDKSGVMQARLSESGEPHKQVQCSLWSISIEVVPGSLHELPPTTPVFPPVISYPCTCGTQSSPGYPTST